MPSTVLISGVGRQVLLVEAFKEAVGRAGTVVACDIDPNAAALRAADVAEQSLRFEHPGFVDHVLELCAKHSIGVLLTLLTDELRVLERSRERLRALGVNLVGAPLDSLELANDKYQLAKRFRADTLIGAPRTWLASDLPEDFPGNGPFVLKPRYGRGSQGLALAPDEDAVRELLAAKPDREQYVVQDFVRGEEFGLDIINNLDGDYCALLARRKLAMRGGETDVAVTIDSGDFETVARALSRCFRHQGSMDVDVIMGEQGRLVLLDVNIRFGGGYAFSHEAGAHVPRCITAWANGGSINPSWLSSQAGTISARASRIIRLHSSSC
jgi:carbamoyl-phosphate synthase large subunit